MVGAINNRQKQPCDRGNWRLLIAPRILDDMKSKKILLTINKFMVKNKEAFGFKMNSGFIFWVKNVNVIV